MLGVLCARPKPWILNFSTRSSNYNQRRFHSSSDFTLSNRHHNNRHSFHSTTAATPVTGVSSSSSAAAIWHVIQPSAFKKRRNNYVRRLSLAVEPRGEGSWNVAWDARPARWLQRPDSAWLLFGVCGTLNGPVIDFLAATSTDSDVINPEIIGNVDEKKSNDNSSSSSTCENDDGSNGLGGFEVKTDTSNDNNNNDYKVTGVLADGRCLFRAIAHGACLRSGEEVPDEIRQRELADQLRAQVVDELLKRRKETEWFIEGDFDAYVKRIQQPFVWGGEPELLMASHVLKTMISVFMTDRASGNLVNIANYGEEYRKDQVKPINVLFHGYGHYEILESSAQGYQNVNM